MYMTTSYKVKLV